jgi:SAM-dependent methyltransferase
VFGELYEHALDGERCWVRHDDGSVHRLPVQNWLGGTGADAHFDEAVVDMCAGPTIDLGCGPGRLVASLVRRGIPALGIDLSPAAIVLAHRSGAPALRRNVFDPLPGTGHWHTVLLADGNVGLGGDPRRVLCRAAELLHQGGRCVAEFDSTATGVNADWLRLETRRSIGPWFRWASVGIDCAAALAQEVGLAVADVRWIGGRVVATLAAT